MTGLSVNAPGGHEAAATSARGPFRPGLVIGLIVAGIVSFAAFVMLLAWGGDNAGGRSGGRGTALGVSAIGFKALVDLTGRFHDTDLVRSAAYLDTPDLVVVALEPSNTRAQVRELLRRRRDAPTVLILPKWAVQPDPSRRGWVRSAGAWLGPAAVHMLGGDVDVTPVRGRARRGDRVPGEDLLRGIGVDLPRAAQVIHGDDVEPLLDVPGEGALVARLGYQPHYVVADPDLLNNHGLRDPDAARAAVRMLARLMPEDGERILFDLTVNGAGRRRSILRSMLEPPFLALTLALVAAAILAGLHGATRFGPARAAARAIPFGKAALVENSAGLIRLAGRDVRLGGGYADVVRDEAARAGAAPARLQGTELEAYLDRFGRGEEASFSVLAARVRSARDRGELVSAARALFRWKRDMIR